MDEILIEEKKYISSKQAAKITGYAKDYIGQLCREGRVPARLVGRSWYVLETAIQDHRFGDPVEPEEILKEDKEETESTWESPRYEAYEENLLPSLNRIKEKDDTEEYTEEEVSKGEQTIQDSWREWFDRIENKVTAIVEQEERAEAESPNVQIPIRAIYQQAYQPPPEELLPRRATVESVREPVVVIRKAPRRFGARAIQITGVSLAFVSVILAVVGSGYFDSYILSSSPARIIAGVALYNK